MTNKTIGERLGRLPHFTLAGVLIALIVSLTTGDSSVWWWMLPFSLTMDLVNHANRRHK
jgi:hypothetical protein